MKIEKIKLNKENLEKIKKIDETFYKNDVLSIDWYLERYNDNHTAIVLINDNNECVGYLVCVPVKKELYEAISNGVIIDDLYINPSMFVNNSIYQYVISCVILEKYRNNNYGTKLMEELFKDDSNNYIALTISKEGQKLASKFMKMHSKLNESVHVYIKDKQ